MSAISRNDYILSSGVAGMEIRLDSTLSEGEWAVPVTFSDPALVRFLQPCSALSRTRR